MPTTRTLYSGGPTVGAVGLGCMGMSWAYAPSGRDHDSSVAAIRAAVTHGVTLLDTADVYGPFRNEELVGEALAGLSPADRETVTVATKGGLVVGDRTPGRVPGPDGRPEHIRDACVGSLRRLGVETIDLYQLHRVDPRVPLADTWGAMAGLVADGLVRAVGMSEVTPAQLDEAAAIHPVATVQSEFSVWTREPLTTVIPWCRAHGAGFLPFSPLGRGFLTGTVTDVEFERKDFRAHNPRFTDEARAANRPIVDLLGEIAGRHRATTAQVALAWLLAQDEAVIPIPGSRDPARVVENARAADLVLDPADLARIDALPAPVGDRY